MLQDLKIGDFVEFVKPQALILDDVRWFILLTEPGREETAAKGLKARGFPAYLPVFYKKLPAGRGKTREVSRPLFPCYAFAPLPKAFEGQDFIKHIPGVFDFMMTGEARSRRFATLSDDAIAAIKEREDEIEGLRKGRLIKTPHGGIFEIGQPVSVPIPSAFTTLAGKIGTITGKNVEVLLEMEFMGRKTITVDDRTLIAAEQSREQAC
jgi:transcription antitermination factor NusG